MQSEVSDQVRERERERELEEKEEKKRCTEDKERVCTVESATPNHRVWFGRLWPAIVPGGGCVAGG